MFVVIVCLFVVDVVVLFLGRWGVGGAKMNSVKCACQHSMGPLICRPIGYGRDVRISPYKIPPLTDESWG